MSKIILSTLNFQEVTPRQGAFIIAIDSNDGIIKKKNPDGTIINLESGGANLVKVSANVSKTSPPYNILHLPHTNITRNNISTVSINGLITHYWEYNSLDNSIYIDENFLDYNIAPTDKVWVDFDLGY
jgi:hypothetical protein